MPSDANRITRQLAEELRARPAQIEAAVALLDGGATVPFIARYRKEATDGLDDVQLRELELRLAYLRELEDRRVAVINRIDEQGKLDNALRAADLQGARSLDVNRGKLTEALAPAVDALLAQLVLVRRLANRPPVGFAQDGHHLLFRESTLPHGLLAVEEPSSQERLDR